MDTPRGNLPKGVSMVSSIAFLEESYPEFETTCDERNRRVYSEGVVNIQISRKSSKLDADTPDEIDDVWEDMAELAEDMGSFLQKEIKEGLHSLMVPEEISLDFNWTDAVWGIVSAATFIIDHLSDFLLAIQMKHDPENRRWFLPTLLILAIPLVVQNLFSLYWYWFDMQLWKEKGRPIRRTMWMIRGFSHMFLIGPVLRQMEVIYLGSKCSRIAKHKNYLASLEDLEDDPQTKQEKGKFVQQLWLHAERDSASLELFGTLLQDAPQMILQIYIIGQTTPSFYSNGKLDLTFVTQIASIVASLFTMAWTVTSFTRSVRLASSRLSTLSPAQIFLLSVIHFSSVAPQVFSFALVSLHSKYICAAVVVGHWMVSTLSTFLQLKLMPSTAMKEAAFAHDWKTGVLSWVDDLAFSLVIGMGLLYTYIDVDGASPYLQASIYALVRIVEEIALISVWFVSFSDGSSVSWTPYMIISSFYVFYIICCHLLQKFVKMPKDQNSVQSFSTKLVHIEKTGDNKHWHKLNIENIHEI